MSCSGGRVIINPYAAIATVSKQQKDNKSMELSIDVIVAIGIGLISAIYWAASITNRMDTIIKLLSDHSALFISHDIRLDDHEKRIAVIEAQKINEKQ
jgi:hypothetical protein